MTGWIIGGIVLLLLTLLALMRVGAVVEYKEELIVNLRAGPLRITVLPQKKQAKKKKEHPDKAEEKSELGGTVRKVRDMLPLVLDTAKKFKKKLRIELLIFDFTAASDDPASAAILYGGVCATLGVLLPLMDNHFDIKDRQVRTNVSFELKKPVIYLKTAFSLAVWQGVVIGTGFLIRYLKWQGNQKKQNADWKKAQAIPMNH